jgi:predicted GNAT family acetyltransferase
MEDMTEKGRHRNQKLTFEHYSEIKELLIKGELTHSKIGHLFGISHTWVGDLKRKWGIA